MCPLGYHHNGFLATHALGQMMYSYTLLLPINQECSTSKARIVIYVVTSEHIILVIAHLASIGSEQSVCYGSLMTTYITLLALLVEKSWITGTSNL